MTVIALLGKLFGVFATTARPAPVPVRVPRGTRQARRGSGRRRG